ncbi:MAG: DUF1788 domain-containing protein [Planctomycetes bacterium]|nr:DUF1788 domain-containing protein [Planctomycetota bacterium]
MGRIEDLAEIYEKNISPPWLINLAGAQKTIFVVYDKTDERRLRARRQLFELATRRAGHGWREFDFTSVFPEWMAKEEYREAYFEAPEDLELKLENEFVDFAAARLRVALLAPVADSSSVVGVFGAATLFGFTRVSLILKHVEGDIRGRLVLFFPGQYDQNHYRLLDARDGWNYLAVPIALHGSGEGR